MLLNVDLAEEAPAETYTPIVGDSVFIGCVVNSLYDEKRIHFNQVNGQMPKRWAYDKNAIHLYGFLFSPKGEDKVLLRQLKEFENIDLLSYNSLLNEYNYSCDNNYIKIQHKMFPVDPVYIQRYIPEYSYERILEFSSEIPHFQQFTTFNMYFLVNQTKAPTLDK